MTLGDGENPIILAAVYDEEASLYAVQQIMGELLPAVTLEAQGLSSGRPASVIIKNSGETTETRLLIFPA